MRLLNSIIIILICLPYLHLKAQEKEVVKKDIGWGQSFELESRVLGEIRTLNVYLPLNFKENDTQRYDVIYLLDGGLDEDFLHIAGLVQFAGLPWVGDLPPCIVVGIANTDRKRDMAFPTRVAEHKTKYPTTGGSSRFIKFIKEEVKPFIGARFKTGHSNYLIGQSLAGLLATEILLSEPDLFSHYIIVSPSLWWDNGSLLQKQTEALKKTRLNIYIAVGKEGLTPEPHPRVMEVDAYLLEDKLKKMLSKDSELYMDYLPQETHGTITHQAVYNAFRKFGLKQKKG